MRGCREECQQIAWLNSVEEEGAVIADRRNVEGVTALVLHGIRAVQEIVELVADFGAGEIEGLNASGRNGDPHTVEIGRCERLARDQYCIEGTPTLRHSLAHDDHMSPGSVFIQ